MSGEIRRYVLVDENDVEHGDYEDYHEAEADARAYGWAVVAYVFEFADSELVFTPNGEDTWPVVN